MKKVLIFTLGLLTACGSGKHSGTGTGSANLARSNPDLTRAFNDTSRVDQATLLGMLRDSMAAGRPLGSLLAERCWQKEQGRAALAEACLLAWSVVPQKSEFLEKEIARLAPGNHAAAVAAIRSETPLGRLGESELRQVLTLLRDDPVWLRAKAVLAWRLFHSAPAIVENDAWIALLATDEAIVPADFRFGYLATKALDGAKAAIFLAKQCNPLAAEELRFGCWRFLSTFADAKGAGTLPDELASRLPAPDRSWAAFRLDWPDRARLLEPFLPR